LGAYWCVHALPQLMKVSFDVTVPVPLPPSVTTSESLSAKLACTLVSAETVNVHGAVVPSQPPPVQPTNVLEASGAAVSVTEVPTSYFCEQLVPQLMPVGAEVTVPVPLPPGVTVTVNCIFANAALTVVSVLTVIVQVAAVPQPPPV